MRQTRGAAAFWGPWRRPPGRPLPCRFLNSAFRVRNHSRWQLGDRRLSAWAAREDAPQLLGRKVFGRKIFRPKKFKSKSEFYNALYKHHPNLRSKMKQIGSVKIDMWTLYNEVQALGGHAESLAKIKAPSIDNAFALRRSDLSPGEQHRFVGALSSRFVRCLHYVVYVSFV